MLALAALAISCGTTACGKPPVRHRSADAAPSCPAKSPAARSPEPQHKPIGPLVRQGPVVASLCQYARGASKPADKNVVIPRLVIRGVAAAGLAAVVDGAGPVTARASRCDRPAGQLPFSQVIVFGYRDGQSSAVDVSHTDCSLAIVTSGRRSAVLAGLVEDDLFAMTGLNPHSRGGRTPDLVGLTGAAAWARYHSSPLGIAFDGAAIDPAAKFGTVIFQTPPSGLRVDRIDSQIGVLLAVAPAPACTRQQLGLSYFGAEPGAGNIFAAIVVRDISASPCRLVGPVRVTGLGDSGKAVTGTAAAVVTAPGVLSPGAVTIKGGMPVAGSLTETISIAAEYRDDPASPTGLCTPHWVIPATWSVSLPGGIVLSVPNADPASQAKLIRSGAFVTCRGRFGIVAPVGYSAS
jgi:hypothetical protein